VEGILPGDAVLEREHGVPIGRSRDKREDDQREARLIVGGVEVCEILVVELRVEYVADELDGLSAARRSASTSPVSLGISRNCCQGYRI
jgi:hypothetical protein